MSQHQHKHGGFNHFHWDSERRWLATPLYSSINQEPGDTEDSWNMHWWNQGWKSSGPAERLTASQAGGQMTELWEARDWKNGGDVLDLDSMAAAEATWTDRGRDVVRRGGGHKGCTQWPAARQCCNRPLTAVSSWWGHKLKDKAAQTRLWNPPQLHE